MILKWCFLSLTSARTSNKDEKSTYNHRDWNDKPRLDAGWVEMVWLFCSTFQMPSRTRPRKCPFILLIARLTNIRQEETVKDLLAYAKEVTTYQATKRKWVEQPHIYKEDPRMIWGEHQLMNGGMALGTMWVLHTLCQQIIYLIATCSLWRTSGHVRPTWASVSNTSMRLADLKKRLRPLFHRINVLCEQ